MNESHDTTQTPSTEEESLDPRDAQTMMTETKEKALRDLELNSMLLCLLGGSIIIVGFGIIWMSVRHQHPYQGPTPGAIGLFYLLVIVVDLVAIAAYRRSSRGVRGRRSKDRLIIGAVGATGLVGVFIVMGALDYAGVSHSVVYGIYPATVPLLFASVIAALGAASRDDWTLFASALLISLVCASAAFGGPAGAWFIAGLGSGVLLFSCAGVKLYQRRSR
jgi:hypothetical protein